MGSRYDFHSPGSSAVDALTQVMLQRQAMKRQELLDSLQQQQVASQIADRSAGRDLEAKRIAGETEQRALMARQLDSQEAERKGGLALKIAGVIPSGADVAPETEAALGNLAPTLVKHSGGGVVDESVGEGPQDETRTFIGTQADKQSEAANDIKLEIAAMVAESKKQQAELQRQVAEGKITQQQAQLQNQRDSLDIRERLAAVAERNSESKIAATDKTKNDAALGVANSRKEVRDLIDGIMNDPHLDSVVGPVAGATPSILPTSRDLDNRIATLQSKLSINGRGAMKGQGQISDFEGKMLAKAQTSLSQRTNREIFLKELQRLRSTMEGDVPHPDTWNPEAGNTPASGRSNHAQELLKKYGSTSDTSSEPKTTESRQERAKRLLSKYGGL